MLPGIHVDQPPFELPVKVSGHELVMKGLCTRERQAGHGSRSCFDHISLVLAAMQVGLGLGECIASGLRKIDGPQAQRVGHDDVRAGFGCHSFVTHRMTASFSFMTSSVSIFCIFITFMVFRC